MLRAKLVKNGLMRLKTLSLHPYTLPLSNDSKRSGALLCLTTKKNQIGYGDVAPLPNWSQETLLDALCELRVQKNAILKMNWNLDNYLEQMKNLSLLPSTSFALESALFSLLENAPLSPVLFSALLTGLPEEILKQAEHWKKQGVRSAKLKVSGLAFPEAKFLLDALIPHFHLRVDVNRAWTKEESLAFFSQFPLDIFDYVEEPFKDPKDLSLFPHPLAIDESFPNDLSLKDLETLPTLKALIYKPTIQGGMEVCKPLYEWTQRKNISFVLSSSFESDAGIFSIVSMANRLSLPSPIGIGPLFFLKEYLFKEPFQIANGYLKPPQSISPKIPPTSVAGAIFSSDRKEVLLVQRRDVPVWVLPGGGIESGETAEEAIFREIQEETGCEVRLDRFVGDYIPLNRLAKPTQLFAYQATKRHLLQENPECRQVRFFPLDRLPKEIPPPYREWIQDALERKKPVYKKLTSVNYGRFFWYLLSHPILTIRFLLARLGRPINS